MFKLAAITDEISQDPAVAAALVKEFGGEALEIRSVWEKGPHEDATRLCLESLREMLQQV